MKYIGGEFTDLELAFLRSPNVSKSFDKYFPNQLGDRRRFFLEVGVDAIFFLVSSLCHGKKIKFWSHRHFCQNSLERLKIKLGERIEFHQFEVMEEIKVEDNTILLLHYFNRFDPELQSSAKKLKQAFPDLVIIEDFVQAPFDMAQTSFDASFTSLRKMGVGEVAIAYIKDGDISECSRDKSNYLAEKELAIKIKEACLQHFDSNLENEYLKKFEYTKKLLDSKKSFQAFSTEILKAESVDFDLLRKIRKENYQYLLNGLKDISSLVVIPGSEMYFMFKAPRRDELRSELFKNGVFPVVHWVDANTELSKSILSLHIDHRYRMSDLDKVIKIIKTFYGETNE